MLKRLVPLLLMLGLLLAFVSADAAGKSEYRIRVDIKNQIVTVYRLSDGGIQRQMICSTGKGNATPLGSYDLKTRKSTDRKEWYHISAPYYVQYATRITGPFLFHSVPYSKPNTKYLIKSQYNLLGSKASAGCVRLRSADAKWISDNCPDGTRVTIFNTGTLNKPLRAALKIATFDANATTYEAFLESNYIATQPGDLGRGSDETAVRTLQARLSGMGLFEGTINGDYNDSTIEAVKRYQNLVGAPVTGVASEALIAQLLEDNDPAHTGSLGTFDIGANGPAVEKLQRTLAACGLYSGAVDGVFNEDLALATDVLSIYSGMGSSRVATPALREKADELLASLNDYYGEGNFAAELDVSFIRTVRTAAATGLYKKASTSSTKLLTVPKNKKVTLLSEDAKYSRVKYGGKTGYIKTGALKSTYNTDFTLYWGIPVENTGERMLNADTIGAAVKQLQRRLNALGFYAGAIDGHYSDDLADAVHAYQTAAGLEPTGEADVDLQDAVMNDDSVTGLAIGQKPGDESPVVASAQRRLKALGYYEGDVTGSFDDATAEAVKLFTRSNGIGETAEATPAVLAAIKDQYDTYGDGTHTLTITELRTPMAKLKQSDYMRKKASTSSVRLKKVSKGKSVTVISKGAKWTCVSYGGKTGYILNSHLKFYDKVEYVAEFDVAPTAPETPEIETADETAEEIIEEPEQPEQQVLEEADAIEYDLDVEYEAVEADEDPEDIPEEEAA